MLRQTLTVTFAGSVAATALAAGGTAAVATPPFQAAQAKAAPVRHIAYRQWATPRQLRAGHTAGAVVRADGVRLRRPGGTRTFRDPAGRRVRYEFGRWTSPWVRPGFGLTEAIASWTANTPRGTWVAVQMRGRTPAGRLSSWDTLARWASHEHRFHRTSLGEQADDVARVATDTLQTRGRSRLNRWQVRVTLYRRAGTSQTPWLRAVGAMASRLPAGDPPTTGTTMRRTVDLTVPRRSQMIHRGDFPQWGGGGEAWCSPTSTTMLLAFWNRGPRPRQYSWVTARAGSGHRNPEVDFAARSVFDHGYDGTGNWPFNTAYAGRFRTQSFVTRLRSLREAERFVRRGIPLAASVRFGAGELTGVPSATQGGTNGHLLVIRGFTSSGDVIVNDPAARGNRGVRRVYQRAEFADAWVGGSGGLVYVIRPEGRVLPRRTAEANW